MFAQRAASVTGQHKNACMDIVGDGEILARQAVARTALTLLLRARALTRW